MTMHLPKLNDSQIRWITEQAAAYIEGQRQTYARSAVALNQDQRRVMRPFFPTSALDSTRIVTLGGERVANPPFYGELVRMGFEASSLPNFSLMGAITFVDTLVSHEAVADRLLFHELVHVVQYEKLGVVEFAAKYVTGFLRGGSYGAIPLERNAYELDERFAAQPWRAFSVEVEVQQWIATSKF